MNSSNLLNAACLALFLTACGGGGGGSSPQPSVPSNNLPPSVNISAPTEVNSGDLVSLSANATDADGSITSYLWAKESGAAISLSDTSKLQATFVAPEVDTESSISVSVTVVDDKGATTKSVKQITIKNVKESLVISGSVFNGGFISNADITVTAGDATFSTKTNAAGQYSIPLTVSKKNLKAPISITALGDAKYPDTKLAVQLDSMSKLLEQAGSDKVLDAKENAATNISNWTTAEYALLTATSYWGYISPIPTDAELQTALQSLVTSKKVSLATYLEIIATDARFKLPLGYKNTLEFARDMASADTFANEVYSKDPSIFPTISARIAKEHSPAPAPVDTGDYILSGAGPSAYLIKLNPNGLGELKTKSFTTQLKWVKQDSKVIMTFVMPLETGSIEVDGKWVIKGAELSIVDRHADFSRADFVLNKSVINADGKELYRDSEFYKVDMFDQTKFVSPALDKIAGEWASDSGIYQFNADKSGTFKPYKDPAKITEFSWSLENKALALKMSEGLIDTIYFVRDLDVGYSYVKISDSVYPKLLTKGMLVKPTQNLSLTKSDLVGNWVDSGSELSATSSIRVMTSDGIVYKDFVGVPSPWTINQTNDGWTQSFYKQGFNDWASSCDSAQGTDCRIYRTYTDKVVAIKDSNYYSLRTEKIYYDKDQPYVSNSLILSRKLPEIDHFAPWIKSKVRKSFYQVTGDTTKVWSFFENRLTLSNKTLVSVLPSGNDISFSLKNNRLQYTRENIARELELIGASENGLKVCEFNQGGSCVTGTEFLLSNRSPAKISLKVIGAGIITPAFFSIDFISQDALFGNSVSYDVKPDAGSLVKSVTGCGGQFSANRYTTAEIRDACTITATFGLVPVVKLQVGAHGLAEKSFGNEYRITPDAGYKIDKATGCDGVLSDGEYPLYSLPNAPAEDCTIVIEFKQKLSLEANITDGGLASCVDALNKSDVSQVLELNCKDNVVSSLEGIQNLPNLFSLIAPLIVGPTDLVVPEASNLHSLELGSWSGNSGEPLFDIKAIDVSKAKNLNSLIIRSTRVSTLDLSQSVSLEILYIQNNPNLTRVDLSKNNKLDSADFTNNGLSSIELPNAGVLKTLTVNSNKLANIDLSKSPSLKSLQLNNNVLTSLDLSQLVNLEVVLVAENELTELNISDSIKLEQLQAKQNKITYVDVSKNINLMSLDLASNQIGQISLSNLNKLRILGLEENRLTSIDISANLQLEHLRLQSNRLLSLDISGLIKIADILAFENNLVSVKGIEAVDSDTYIDLHANPFDANTLAYLNNLKTVKNYTNLIF